jgi:hypothetical protein
VTLPQGVGLRQPREPLGHQSDPTLLVAIPATRASTHSAEFSSI